MKYLLILLSFGLFIIWSCSAGSSLNEQLVDPPTFKQLIEKNPDAIVLDIRTEGEIAEGYIQNAQFIDFMNSDFASEVQKQLQSDQTVLVYCRSGGRSAKAFKILQQSGFNNLYELDGGINAWMESDFPLVKP